MRLEWLLTSRHRLDEIWSYVANDSPDAASRLVNRIVTRADGVSANPELGARIPEMPNGPYRHIAIDDYRLIYLRAPDTIYRTAV